MKQKVSQFLFWKSPDLTWSQHVSSLVSHHLRGRWRSGRPGRTLSWSADLLPFRIQAAVSAGGRRESSAGLPTVASAVSITRVKLNHTVLLAAQLSVERDRGPLRERCFRVDQVCFNAGLSTARSHS